MSKDRTKTQEFVFLRLLTSHTNTLLTPEMINSIQTELIEETQTGPCSWAFKQEASDE